MPACYLDPQHFQLQQLVQRFRERRDELAPLIQKINCFNVIYGAVCD